MATCMGWLYTLGILTSGDMQRCLDVLVPHPDGPIPLLALDAMIARANDGLCKPKSAPYMATLLRALHNYPEPESAFERNALVVSNFSKLSFNHLYS